MVNNAEDAANRFAGHVDPVLSCSSTLDSPAELADTPDIPNLPDESWESLPHAQQGASSAPCIEEVEAVIERLKRGRATSGKGIIDLISAGGCYMFLCLLHLSTSAWEACAVAASWRNAILIPLWKGKGRKDCNKYQGMSLLEVDGENVCRNFSERSKQVLRQEHRRIFFLHQLQEIRSLSPLLLSLAAASVSSSLLQTVVDIQTYAEAKSASATQCSNWARAKSAPASFATMCDTPR